MKKVLIMIFLCVFVLTAVAAYAVVSATKHNFTTTGPGATMPGITVCQLCHIPHGGSTATSGLPIWARTNPGANTFTVYNASGAGVNGFTLANTTVNMPGTFSLTCLSCHDGTLAINTITKNTVNVTYAPINNTASVYVNAGNGRLTTAFNATTGYRPNLLQDLRNDHPIGLQYRGTAATNAGLVNAANGAITNGSYRYPLYGSPADRMECASCHDPHDSPAGRQPMLRGLTVQICQDCHANK